MYQSGLPVISAGALKIRNKKISICQTNVHPGEITNLAMQLPEQYSCSPLYMPIKVIHGQKKGPCLVVFSGLTGTELNGLEIANRIIQNTDPSKIAGTIIAIPVMNVYGLTHYPATLPTSADLTNCFPGDKKGSYGERLAHLITHEVLIKADFCIELQTGSLNHNILPQVYCDFSNKKARELAKIFKAPLVTDIPKENNHLRRTSKKLQVPLLIYEAGEAMRFDENAINLGVEGIKNVMHSIDMLEQEPVKETKPIFSKEEDWILSQSGGILHPSVSLGQSIEKGETIGVISDPFGADIIEPIKSTHEGIVVGVNTAPLIHEGLPIFKIASFYDAQKAETAIEEWDKQQPDSYIGEKA